MPTTTKQTVAEKMRELTKYTKYRYAINQVKKQALAGANHTTVITSHCDAMAVQRLEDEGFNIESVNNGNYKAYKISW